jgi:alkanesulfonate monooxygenase SsuD/methylene tetrahydromethanopterin reductase-like flavin-dependent oxidoreductase (luciferase family)
VAGEEDFAGRGLSHCAACDGGFFRGEDVAVIGGGDAAATEALVLARTSRGVIMVCRSPLRAKREYIEKLDGDFWQIRDFKLSPPPVQVPHPPIYIAAATTPESAKFAGKDGQGLVQPGYLGIPFDLVRGLTETYRKNLPADSKSDVVLGIHLHVAKDRNQAIENGALALSSQAEVFLRGRLSRPVQTETIQTYTSKSASREAFEKLCTPEKARQAVESEWPNVMAVWGTPDECIEKIKFYVDAMRPEQLMLNIASGSLAQEKVIASMRICAGKVLPALR